MIVALSIILSGIIVNDLSFAIFCFICKLGEVDDTEVGIYLIWCLIPFAMFAFIIYSFLYALIYAPIKKRVKKKKEEEKCTERRN